MRKAYFWGIVILLSISAVFAAYGTLNHYYNFYDASPKIKVKNGPSKNNPGNNNGKNNNGNNNGKNTDKKVNGYACTTDNCKLADTTNVINDKYQFVEDGNDNIVLYNIGDNKVEEKYKSVEQAGKLYVVRNESDLYGLLKIDDNVNSVYEPKYSYIQYNSTDNQYMVTLNNTSFITDEDGQKISADYTAQIVQYNSKYIITRKSSDEYHIFNFSNKEYLTEYYNAKRLFIELIGDYVGVITDEYAYVLYDFTNGAKVIGTVELGEGNKSARARLNGNTVEVFNGNEVLGTINI